MRSKVLLALLMVGTVAGCASNPPPPPPPVAEVPPPPPPPPALGDVSGLYKGMADLGPDSPARCAKMTRTQTVRVRNNAFVLMGVRATVGPDGTVTAASRRGVSIAGTVSPTGMDLMTTRGKCSYHYQLSKG